uniref:Ig-like domain-containing protein n=1 Tax=Poecilia reticulata TaxID=8081 RepID=A0A3P9PSY3_POERE
LLLSLILERIISTVLPIMSFETILSRARPRSTTQQTSVTVQPGQRLTINCQVSYSVGSYMTHWIRQPTGKGLEWIGTSCDGCSPIFKDSLKNKFSITFISSSNTVTLNGQNMQPEDSAVYYFSGFFSDSKKKSGRKGFGQQNKTLQKYRRLLEATSDSSH